MNNPLGKTFVGIVSQDYCEIRLQYNQKLREMPGPGSARGREPTLNLELF